MAKIPKFKSVEEAAEFWDTHDFEDYVDDTKAVTVEVKIPRRKKTLMLPLPLKTYAQLEAFAAERGVRVEDLMASWLRERVIQESP